jgi:predicted amidohydrolase
MAGFEVAVCQLDSGTDTEENRDTVLEYIEAAAADADLVAFPEMATYVGDEDRLSEVAEPIPGETTDAIAHAAAEHDIHVHAGSIFEESGGDRVYNTSVVIDDQGEILERYRKIHLFDIDVEDGVTYQESNRVAPGERIKTVDTPFATLGLSICYDLRFNEQYNALADAGAEVVFVPAAFTLFTGKDHWIPLLRARAIENQVYVVAPNQIGDKPESVPMYGKSVVIDPWGNVISQASDRSEMITATIDTEYIDTVREELPCREHTRPDVYATHSER